MGAAIPSHSLHAATNVGHTPMPDMSRFAFAGLVSDLRPGGDFIRRGRLTAFSDRHFAISLVR